mgnify:CR=1 FL=1
MSESTGPEVIRALFAEPDDESFAMLQRLFESWFDKYIVCDRAKTLTEAVQLLNSGDYDLVISELIFPGRPETPQQVITTLGTQPGAADTPLAVITDCEDPTMPLKAFREGISEYFAKSDLKIQLMEYRFRNLLQREYRSKTLEKQIDASLDRFRKAFDGSQGEISVLNNVILQMKKIWELPTP